MLLRRFIFISLFVLFAMALTLVLPLVFVVPYVLGLGFCVLWYHLRYKKFEESELWDQQYALNVTALAAIIAKADGQVTPLEIRVFKTNFAIAKVDEDYVGSLFNIFRGRGGDYANFAVTLAGLFKDFPEMAEVTLGHLKVIASCDGGIAPEQNDILLFLAQQWRVRDHGLRDDDDGGPRATRSEKATPDELRSAYKLLGIKAESTKVEVKDKYRKLVRQHHPDRLRAKGASEKEIKKAEDKMAEINAAYKKITDARP